MLSGDVLMPVQFYPDTSATPCQRLLAAILEDAIRCFQKNCGAKGIRRRIIFHEAKLWLFERRDSGFTSCLSVCETLGIDVIQLRRYLRKWKLNQNAGLAAPPVGRLRLVSPDRQITQPQARVSRLARGRKPSGGMRI